MSASRYVLPPGLAQGDGRLPAWASAWEHAYAMLPDAARLSAPTRFSIERSGTAAPARPCGPLACLTTAAFPIVFSGGPPTSSAVSSDVSEPVPGSKAAPCCPEYPAAPCRPTLNCAGAFPTAALRVPACAAACGGCGACGAGAAPCSGPAPAAACFSGVSGSAILHAAMLRIRHTVQAQVIMLGAVRWLCGFSVASRSVASRFRTSFAPSVLHTCVQCLQHSLFVFNPGTSCLSRPTLSRLG